MDATVLHNDSTLAGALVNTQARVPALDGVRGMAIVLVLSFHWIFAALPGWHSADLTISEAVIRRLTMLNWAGVDLFFVLSGFVIGAIILDNRDAGNFLRLPSPLHTRCRRDASRRRFHIIKTLRPQHHGGYTRPLRRTWMTSYLRPRRQVPIKGLGNTWSLAVEEQFYFLAPALLLIVPRRFTAHVLLIGIVLAPLTRIAYCLSSPSCSNATYSLLPCRMDALLVGVLAAWGIRDRIASVSIKRKIGLVRLTGLADADRSRELHHPALERRRSTR